MPNTNPPQRLATRKQGEELYNRLMAVIEPELTTDQIPLLKEKHKGETKEQAKTRAARYKKAFAEYETQLQKESVQMREHTQSQYRDAMQSIEQESLETEKQTLTQLEQAMFSA